MASRLDMDAKDVQRIAGSFIAELAENLCDGDSLAIQGFGSFEVRKNWSALLSIPQRNKECWFLPNWFCLLKPAKF